MIIAIYRLFKGYIHTYKMNRLYEELISKSHQKVAKEIESSNKYTHFKSNKECACKASYSNISQSLDVLIEDFKKLRRDIG